MSSNTGLMATRLTHACAAACVGAAFFVVALTIFMGNAADLGDGGQQLIVPALIAVSMTCLSFGGSLLSLYHPAAIAAAQVITFCLLAAGFVFGGSVPPLDGGQHDFVVDRRSALLELALFATVLFSLVVLIRRHTAKMLGLAAAAIILLAGTALLKFTQQDDTAQSDPELLTSLTALSHDLNIVHIMFDSLQADAFQAVLDETPSLKAAFDGFTLYTDHAGYSNWTSLSLPALLTGRQFFEDHEEDVDAIDEIAGWIRSESLMTELSGQAFDVSAIMPGEIYCHDAPFTCTTLPSLTKATGHDFGMREANLNPLILTDLTLLRLAPTLAKPLVYNKGTLLFSKQGDDEAIINSYSSPVLRDLVLSRDFADVLTRSLWTASERPVYKFLHFYPPHKPFVFDADCALGEVRAATWDSYLPQATCAVRLIADILNRLKTLDLYDRTIVIIQADTGLGMVQSPDPKAEMVSAIVEYTADQLVAFARPTFAIKGLDSRGSLTVSARKTSHVDTFSLIEEASNGRIDLPSRKEESPRRFAVSEIARRGSSTLMPFESFVINGDVGDFSSWEIEGRFLKAGVAAGEETPITSAKLDIEGSLPARPGERLVLSAVTVGGVEKEYLFFRRLKQDQFDVIQEWSNKPSVTYLVKEGGRTPCVSELLLAVRNRVRFAQKYKVTVERPIPLTGDGCPAPQ